MKRSNKILIGTGALATVLATGLAVTTGPAGASGWGNNDGDCGFHGRGRHGGGPAMMMEGGRHGGPGGGFANRDKPYTAEEVETLARAMLLRRGPDTLTVGDITETEAGFSVEIITREGGVLVNTLTIDPGTGMPAGRGPRR